MLDPCGWEKFNAPFNTLSDISLLELIFVSDAFRVFSECVQHITMLANRVSENGGLTKSLKWFDPVAGKNDIVRRSVAKKIVQIACYYHVQVKK